MSAAAGEGNGEGEAQLLVSEFPPPPFYYTEVANLRPPDIPKEALDRGTRRAAAAAARAREAAERLRLADDSTNTDAILGGVRADEKEEEGEVIGVFGEVVEDPLLTKPLDFCEDPTVVRDEVMRLNREVVKGFIKLVQDLVHRPADNKKGRDELSHNIFLMLQETNKFREHQSREILIGILEKQLEDRSKLVEDLEQDIQKADALLANIPARMDES